MGHWGRFQGVMRVGGTAAQSTSCINNLTSKKQAVVRSTPHAASESRSQTSGAASRGQRRRSRRSTSFYDVRGAQGSTLSRTSGSRRKQHVENAALHKLPRSQRPLVSKQARVRVRGCAVNLSFNPGLRSIKCLLCDRRTFRKCPYCWKGEPEKDRHALHHR